MGASSSHPIFLALDELLRSKDIKVRRSVLQRFVGECAVVAPWFVDTGSLTLPSWDKLGRDIDFASEQGTLKKGVRPIWKLVRGCLEDRRCSDALESGQATLEQLQEEHSEKARSEREASVKSEKVASVKSKGSSKKSKAKNEKTLPLTL